MERPIILVLEPTDLTRFVRYRIKQTVVMEHKPPPRVLLRMMAEEEVEVEVDIGERPGDLCMSLAASARAMEDIGETIMFTQVGVV